MNKDWILFHLREGLGQLAETIASLESKSAYGEIEFGIDMEHVYNHLNTAWNSRKAAPQRMADCSNEDFYAWRAFPADISMGE
jgi:hypothetical protein